jgi:hypothetical protein
VNDEAGKLTSTAPGSEDPHSSPLSLPHRLTTLGGETLRDKTAGESRISARDNTWHAGEAANRLTDELEDWMYEVLE